MIRRIKWALAKWLYPEIYAMGAFEARDDVGMTYGGDPNSLKSIAYDLGRSSIKVQSE